MHPRVVVRFVSPLERYDPYWVQVQVLDPVTGACLMSDQHVRDWAEEIDRLCRSTEDVIRDITGYDRGSADISVSFV